MGGMARLGLSVLPDSIQAVAIDSDERILASSNLSWSGPIDEGIRTIVPPILAKLAGTEIASVMLASTVLSDVLRSQARLARVGVLRIGLTSTAIPPFSGWPEDLASRILGPRTIVAGGADLDGQPLEALDHEAVAEFARSCEGAVDAITISSVFSPIAAAHEFDAASTIIRTLGGAMPITLSHTVGGFGLVERENAAIMSASLAIAGPAMIHSARSALRESGITAELYLAQNDGTLLGADVAAERPIRVLDSRLATAVRGAGRLSGVSDAIVLDFDGELPRAGVLRAGDVVLGFDQSMLAGVRVIQYLPLAFDEPRSTRPVERLRRHARDATVVAVGTIGDGAAEKAGIAESMLVPVGAEFASALGAVTADVSAVHWAFLDAEGDRDALLAAIRQKAIDEAILAGADPSTTGVVAVHETPLSYMTGEPRRLLVRAAGRPFSAVHDHISNPDERKAP